ncbi:MAG: hypothetical protein P9M06_00910 [Candidatus Saelkia tenebricola]|nr:hypothetical protein [Candidatus Saelkia tenebricola]
MLSYLRKLIKKSTEFSKNILSLIPTTNIPGRHSARNAIAMMEKTYTLIEIDPEMAAFRAITSAEEAATAIIHSLKKNITLILNF